MGQQQNPCKRCIFGYTSVQTFFHGSMTLVQNSALSMMKTVGLYSNKEWFQRCQQDGQAQKGPRELQNRLTVKDSSQEFDLISVLVWHIELTYKLGI